MPDFDLFEFYRFLLALLVGSYAGVRLTLFLLHLSGLVEATIPTALARRYLIVLLLRVRLRRFVYELAVVGGLTVALAVLILMHWR